VRNGSGPPRTASARARHTDQWTETIFRAVSAKVAKRWRFVSFRGKSKGEWRGVVDVLAIRKDSAQPEIPSLKRGDLFEIVLIQMKGGSARRPNMEERGRLRAVARRLRANAVVLFEWDRGILANFSVLGPGLQWKPSSCRQIFG